MEYKRLTEICTPKQWKTIATKDLLECGYPVYGANGKIGFFDEYTHKEETLMITCRGATCGNLNISEPYSYINGNAMALDNLIEDINLKYLYYYLKNRKLLDTISGSAQPQITRASLEKVIVKYPKLENQKKIVSILDKSLSLIEKKKEQIELLDELVKSTFIEMFGDPINNPKEWDKIELKEGIKEIKYGTSTPPDFSEKGIPFIRATNIKLGRIIENDMKYISEEEAKKIEKCKLSLGDTIIVRSGANTGDNAFVSKKYVDCYGGYDIIVKLNEKINYIFLNVLLNSVYREVVIQPLTRRAGQPHLNSDQIKSLVVYNPPIELQNEFASFVEKTDSIRSKMEASLSELEDNFNALMQKAFKGELF